MTGTTTILRALRPIALTPPGRPLETGWLAEIATWLWQLFVLRPDEARPSPRWMRRLFRPALLLLARSVHVSNPRSLRSWVLGLLLVDPPQGYWSDPAHHRANARHRPTAPLVLLRRRLRPYLEPLESSSAAVLERSARILSAAYEQASLPARGALLLTAALLFAIAASTPLGHYEQLTLLLVMWMASLLVREIPGHAPALILMAFSLIASGRYIWWRLTQTLDLEPGIEWLLGAGLLAAECYTWLVLTFGYIQNSRPLGRKSAPLPPDRALWPTVDVFIPTYNEPLKVVKPTVLAALSLDWPAEKLNVFILDDGRREEFRDFAAACGARYLTRPDNRHAKAGNLNHALTVTGGELLAIFDCDHIPVRSFLTATVGWFLRDPKCAMLQTPHHFFSPDPFERNLGTFRRVPNEGRLFYGLIQDGNDLWNAAFFCGSCAVLRRGPLEEIGGIAVETVTEDAHTALKMHRRGYTTAYLRETLAGGLATESLSGHIGQRIRWARGMAQIFRLDNPFRGPGLGFFQRLCYSNAMLHYFSGLPRLVFLTAPLGYLFFEFHVINAAAATLAVYALPHLVQSAIANSHVQGRFRHSFWNEAYEAALSWYITLPTTVALIAPRHGKFNVTAKGGLMEHDFFDWRIAAPYMALVLLNVAGALIAIPRLFLWNSFEAATVVVNLLWTLFNLVLLGAVLGVAAEVRQVRNAHRVPATLRATLHLTNGRTVDCETEDFSMHGLRLRVPDGVALTCGQPVAIGLTRPDGSEARFPAEVTVVRRDGVGLKLDALPLAQEKDYVQLTFARPNAWLQWNAAIAPDRPLASFAEVFSFGATGYVRLLENLYMSLLTRLRRVLPAAVADP